MQEAERLRELHTKEYPDYKYQPRQRRNRTRVQGTTAGVGTRGQHRREEGENGGTSTGVHAPTRKPPKRTKSGEKTGKWEEEIRQVPQPERFVALASAANGRFVDSREMSLAISGDVSMTSWSAEASENPDPGLMKFVDYSYDEGVFHTQQHPCNWAPLPQGQGHGQGQGQDQLPYDLSNLYEDCRDFSNTLLQDLQYWDVELMLNNGSQPFTSSEIFQPLTFNPAAPIQMENVHQYPGNCSTAIDYPCYSHDSWSPSSFVSQPEAIESQEPFYSYDEHYEPVFKSI